MTRPYQKQGERLYLRLPPDQKAALEKLAAERGVTVSDLIRTLIDQELAKTLPK